MTLTYSKLYYSGLIWQIISEPYLGKNYKKKITIGNFEITQLGQTTFYNHLN